jgi:hypothetical protein
MTEALMATLIAMVTAVVAAIVGIVLIEYRKARVIEQISPHAPKPTGEVYVPKNEGDVPW